MEVFFGILGIIGGLLTLIGDLFLEFRGAGNQTLGKYGFIESNWTKMAVWRFKLSAMLGAVGVPLYFLGFTSLAMQMTNKTFAVSYWLVCVIGSCGGVFIHGLLCIYPIIYKSLSANLSFEKTEDVLNAIFNFIKIPFFFNYFFLVVISSFFVIYAIIIGYLSLSTWFIVFTPLFTLIIGLIIKAVFKREPAGITSFGIAMTGVMAIINYMM